MGTNTKGQMYIYFKHADVAQLVYTDIYKANRNIKVNVSNSGKFLVKIHLKIHVKEDIVNNCYEFDEMHCSGRNIDTEKNWRSGYTFLVGDHCGKEIILEI